MALRVKVVQGLSFGDIRSPSCGSCCIDCVTVFVGRQMARADWV